MILGWVGELWRWKQKKKNQSGWIPYEIVLLFTLFKTSVNEKPKVNFELDRIIS